MIELDPDSYISQGGYRLIFEHPSDNTKLIKTVKKKKHSVQRKFKARAGPYINFSEELCEYIVLRSKDRNVEPLVAPIHGLIETTLGLGLVVERISGPDGRLAPTLKDLIREGLVTEDLRKSVDILAKRLAELHVVVNDFTPSNLVLRPDGEGFCLIDGLGEYNVFSKLRVIPFRKMSFWACGYSIERGRRSTQTKIAAGASKAKHDKRGPRWREDAADEKRGA